MAEEQKEQRGPRVLPTFHGYTIDFRLRQFRKVREDTSIDFIPFSSDLGDELLMLMYREWGFDKVDALWKEFTD
jgi:hypothetical protein